MAFFTRENCAPLQVLVIDDLGQKVQKGVELLELLAMQ